MLLTGFSTGFSLSLSLIVAIGAQNSFVLRQGLRREQVAVVVAICALLDITLMTLGVSGLASALGSSPRLLDAIGLLGALALAWYGMQALRRALHPEALTGAGTGQALGWRAAAVQTLSISLLNPHVYLDTVLLVGAVGARQPPGTQGSFLLGAGSGSVLWFTTLGFGARLLAPWFGRPAAWRVLDLVVALTMFAIALGLARGSLHLG